MLIPEYKVTVNREARMIILTDGSTRMILTEKEADAAAYDLRLAAIRLRQLNADTKPKAL